MDEETLMGELAAIDGQLDVAMATVRGLLEQRAEKQRALEQVRGGADVPGRRAPEQWLGWHILRLNRNVIAEGSKFWHLAADAGRESILAMDQAGPLGGS